LSPRLCACIIDLKSKITLKCEGVITKSYELETSKKDKITLKSGGVIYKSHESETSEKQRQNKAITRDARNKRRQNSKSKSNTTESN
jgi:hypothetical protein